MSKLSKQTIIAAVTVRAVLILHNCLAVWRVGISRGHTGFWGLAAGNVFTIVEGVLVVYFNGGLEWKWWCPCFLSYLLTTLPAIWLLQISQYEVISTSQPSASGSGLPLAEALVNISSPLRNTMVSGSFVSVPRQTTTEAIIQSTQSIFEASITAILNLEHDTWLILIQESLVYLLVFGRWILPRSSYSREALADLLLGFLAMASDIMELYAIFDEEIVRKNLDLTYAILAVWSVSFFQFIPVFAHKQKFHHLQSARTKFIRQACGEHFAQIVVTCLSILLQDGPFLCLRLYLLVEYNLVTYSLVFFVLKNIVTLVLLFYRLGILCINLPCCYEEEKEIVEVESVDFSAPVVFKKLSNPFSMHFNQPSAMTNSLNARNFLIGARVDYELETLEKKQNFYWKIQNGI